jgi:hypothetical protein
MHKLLGGYHHLPLSIVYSNQGFRLTSNATFLSADEIRRNGHVLSSRPKTRETTGCPDRASSGTL